MIVLGADTHKRSHTIAAVAAGTGELLGSQTIQVGRRGFDVLLQWARGLGEERVWALEDCRHVSASLERLLIERGERVLRIATHLTAKERKRSRERGKSDAIDALNVARAALQEGIGSFPGRALKARSLIFGCWSITASAWSAIASSSTARCCGTCTTFGRSCSCRAVRCSQRSGRRGSAAAWLALSRRCASRSRATCCAACAS